MSHIFNYLILLGVTFNLYGGASYIKNVIKGKTRPNKITWFFWFIAPMIASAVSFYKGVNLWAIIPVFMSGFIPGVIFLFSLFHKNSYWELKRLDYFCGLFSFLAIVLWLTTKEAAIALVFSILADLFAALPTIIKSYKNPETESAGPFLAGLINNSFVFFVLGSGNRNFFGLAFPVYLITVNIVLIFLIKIRNLELRKTL